MQLRLLFAKKFLPGFCAGTLQGALVSSGHKEIALWKPAQERPILAVLVSNLWWQVESLCLEASDFAPQWLCHSAAWEGKIDANRAFFKGFLEDSKTGVIKTPGVSWGPWARKQTKFDICTIDQCWMDRMPRPSCYSLFDFHASLMKELCLFLDADNVALLPPQECFK